MTLKLNSAGIIGIGYHVPEKILTNADIEKNIKMYLISFL